ACTSTTGGAWSSASWSPSPRPTRASGRRSRWPDPPGGCTGGVWAGRLLPLRPFGHAVSPGHADPVTDVAARVRDLQDALRHEHLEPRGGGGLAAAHQPRHHIAAQVEVGAAGNEFVLVRELAAQGDEPGDPLVAERRRLGGRRLPADDSPGELNHVLADREL